MAASLVRAAGVVSQGGRAGAVVGAGTLTQRRATIGATSRTDRPGHAPTGGETSHGAHHTPTTLTAHTRTARTPTTPTQTTATTPTVRVGDPIAATAVTRIALATRGLPGVTFRTPATRRLPTTPTVAGAARPGRVVHVGLAACATVTGPSERGPAPTSLAVGPLRCRWTLHHRTTARRHSSLRAQARNLARARGAGVRGRAGRATAPWRAASRL